MSESNFTLLSQKEIDALIKFLSAKQSSVTNEVLNQDSIDKLIHLIRNNDINKLGFDSLTPLDDTTSNDLLQNLGLSNTESKQNLISVSQNDTTGFLEIYAINEATREKIIITPSCFEKDNKDVDYTWGYSIAPIIFDKIATKYKMKYSESTYNTVCTIFSTKNYGDPQTTIPKVFLPTSTQLLNHLAKEN